MMKTLLLIITSIFLFKSDEQLFIVDKEVALKPGFYRNFEEFKTNSPSFAFKNYTLTKVSKGYGFMNIAGEVFYYRVNIDKNAAKIMGNVYGFCDGTNIYFNTESSAFKPNSDFAKFDYLGRYCYFQDRAFQTVYNPNGTIGSTAHLDEKVLDINTGEIVSLNKKSLREIMANDAELLADFANETKKNKALKSYLISYSDKHTEEITR